MGLSILLKTSGIFWQKLELGGIFWVGDSRKGGLVRLRPGVVNDDRLPKQLVCILPATTRFLTMATMVR